MTKKRLGMLPLGPVWSSNDFEKLCKAVDKLEEFLSTKYPNHNLQVLTCSWPAYYEMMVVYDMEDSTQIEQAYWLEDHLDWNSYIFAQEEVMG